MLDPGFDPACHCPAAVSGHRIFGRAVAAMHDGSFWAVGPNGGLESRTSLTEDCRRLSAWIRGFDERRHVDPATFRLTLTEAGAAAVDARGTG